MKGVRRSTPNAGQRLRSWKWNAARLRNSRSQNRFSRGSSLKRCRNSRHSTTRASASRLVRLAAITTIFSILASGGWGWGRVIGNIAERGLAAALLMATLKATRRSQCAIALDQPQRLLRSVNQLFYENTTESAYATLFFA